MKKAMLLLLCGTLCFCACRKDPVPEPPSKDAELTGQKVDVSGFPESVRKVFLLNEGGMGSNNATLDFLRVSDGTYVNGAFRKMNPEVGAGLGDVGNDIAVHGDELWLVVNNSGIVEVLSAKDETEIAAIPVPTPRSLAFDQRYAYVTSWAGAYATGSYDENGNYSVTDSKNPKGQVYRIDLETKKLAGSVEVGYQPEGIAWYGGKLYVANSGGISSQLPPDYAYDNTVSVIDTDSFRVERSISVQVNLKNVYADGTGGIYVTTLGDFWSVHSGLYRIETQTASGIDPVSKVADYVSVSALYGDTVYCIGTDSEFDWGAAHEYQAWSVRNGVRKALPLKVSATALYSLGVLDGDTFLVGDAGDYFNPGTVSCYSGGALRWTVKAGVCPGHFALY
ncbi:MAG: hypothetical protein IJ755_01205 [Bacteroidales bacterium]|jgi:sugar lactone lactonase YvrE|nr:hypothetical protein [Bacteroidales bacterium]